MDKKIVFLGRFFSEKSVFGGAGKDFWVVKSEVKKSEKTFFIFSYYLFVHNPFIIFYFNFILHYNL